MVFASSKIEMTVEVEVQSHRWGRALCGSGVFWGVGTEVAGAS